MNRVNKDFFSKIAIDKLKFCKRRGLVNIFCVLAQVIPRESLNAMVLY